MSHVNQFKQRAIYDDARHELEVAGTTDNVPGGPPPPVAIHVAVKQVAPDGSAFTAGQAAVSERLLGDPEWKTRIAGDFVPGSATAFGLAIEFMRDPGAFDTVVWARTITIEAGTLPHDPTPA